jgi:ribosomal protein S24E
METISEKENKLMNRKEAWVRIDHEGKPTPPRKDILAEIAREFKAKEDAIIVDKIFSETGMAASKVKVFVYSSAKDVPKDKLERMKIRMKLAKKGEKEAEKGKPAAEPKPEGGGQDEGETKESKNGKEQEQAGETKDSKGQDEAVDGKTKDGKGKDEIENKEAADEGKQDQPKKDGK